MKRITFISDTHNKHKQVERDLPGGEILIHAGDMTGRGFMQEIHDFCDWFDGLKNYEHKIFIGGNHELGIEDQPEMALQIIHSFKDIIYLQDNEVIIDGIKIWGSPWQPEFFNWAFNLPKNGDKLKEKWSLIPEDTDLLITHGPPFGILDIQSRGVHMGCELLLERIEEVKPKIHVFGHNHFAYGELQKGKTCFINASVLSEMYMYTKLPITIDFDEKNHAIYFV